MWATKTSLRKTFNIPDVTEKRIHHALVLLNVACNDIRNAFQETQYINLTIFSRNTLKYQSTQQVTLCKYNC